LPTAQPPRVGFVALIKRFFGRRLIKAIGAFIEDDMATYAAALSYQVFFSLFPFILFLVALLGSLRIPGLFDWLLNQARGVLPEQAAEVVEQSVGQIRGQASGGLISFGIVVALWSASAAVRMTTNALNNAYDVEEDRPVWKTYLLSVIYTVLLAAIVIVAVILMLVGPQIIEWLAQQIGLGSAFVTLWSWLRMPAAVVLLMVVVALIYYQLPNLQQPVRLITPGAVLAVIVWLGTSFGFSYYVKTFANYSAVYGSLGAVIVLLFYFFISASVLLFGAEVNAQIYYRFAEGASEEEQPLES
jgi:membrane protein